MDPFDDFPGMLGWGYRAVTRWLGRHGFTMRTEAVVEFTGQRYATSNLGGSSIWTRERPGLMLGGEQAVEAVRIDAAGHDVGAHIPREGVVRCRFASIPVAYGERRHLHKECLRKSQLEAYLTEYVPGIAQYDDAGVLTEQHSQSHIWIEP